MMLLIKAMIIWTGATATRPAFAEKGSNKLFEVILDNVAKHYYAPKRIQPARMLKGALEALEVAVPQVIVREVDGALQLHMGQDRLRFPIAEVTSLDALEKKLYQAAAFVLMRVADRSIVMQLQRSMFGAMLATLDPHCQYFPPRHFRRISRSLLGKAGGVGLVVEVRSGKIVVAAVVAGGPADKAGLRVGDHLLRAGQLTLTDLPLKVVKRALEGKVGSRVAVWVRRKGWKHPRRFKLRRRMMVLPSVTGRMLDDRVGWVRISELKANTPQHFKRLVRRLQRQGMKALIIDLRENWGGFVGAAVAIADTMIADGVLLQSVGRRNIIKKTWRAQRKTTFVRQPVVVLTNHHTASAAEILAGCLRAADRAVIMGERTWGKGTAQEIFHTSDGGAYKLSTFQYRPGGRQSLHLIGVAPDVDIAAVAVAENGMDVLSTDSNEGEWTQWVSYVNRQTLETLVAQRKDAPLRIRVLDRARPADRTGGVPRFTDSGRDVIVGLTARLLSTVWAHASTTGKNETSSENGVERKTHGRKSLRDRKKLLSRLRPQLIRTKAAEVKKIQQALHAHGIDWTPPSHSAQATGSPPSLVARLHCTKRRTVAGKALEVRLEVENRGKRPLFQVGGVLHTHHRWLAGKEILLGRIAEGRRAKGKVVVKVPRDIQSGLFDFEVALSVDGRTMDSRLREGILLAGSDRPRFVFGWQIDDRARGNGNGVLEEQEQGKLIIRVKNRGGPAPQVLVDALEPSAGLRVFKPRVVLGALQNNQVKEAAIPIGYRGPAAGETSGRPARLKIRAHDRLLRVSLGRALSLPTAFSTFGCRKTKESVHVRPQRTLFLRSTAHQDGVRVAQVNRNHRLAVDAKCGRWWRVQLPHGAVGFLPQLDGTVTTPAGKMVCGDAAVSADRDAACAAGAAKTEPQWVYPATPPQIEARIATSKPMQSGSPQRTAVRGSIAHWAGIRDFWIATWNVDRPPPKPRKIHYRALAKGKGDRKVREHTFNVKIPLRKGAQMVGIVARGRDDIKTVEKLSVPCVRKQRVTQLYLGKARVQALQNTILPVFAASGASQHSSCGCRAESVPQKGAVDGQGLAGGWWGVFVLSLFWVRVMLRIRRMKRRAHCVDG
jgi:carboxyl-terminal processing protease